jgi:predicted DNA-binding WGR domain protein
MVYLECTTGGHNKFWEVSKADDRSLVFRIRYGVIGTHGTIKNKSFDSPIDCRRAYLDLVLKKLTKSTDRYKLTRMLDETTEVVNAIHLVTDSNFEISKRSAGSLSKAFRTLKAEQKFKNALDNLL